MTGVTQNAVKDDAAFAPQLARDLERVPRRGVDAGAVIAAVDFERDVQAPGPHPRPPPPPSPRLPLPPPGLDTPNRIPPAPPKEPHTGVTCSSAAVETPRAS